MPSDVQQLFDEFAVRYARGEDPDVRDFLARAGADAPALARLVDGFLAGSPPPEPPAERVELMRAWVRGEPPLLELRRRQRLKRGEVVSRITALLGLGPEKESAVGGYYHRLENGLLETRGVDGRVWQALRDVLGTDVRSLAAWRPAPIEHRYAFRAAEASAPADYAPTEPEETDAEVARLFLSRS